MHLLAQSQSYLHPKDIDTAPDTFDWKYVYVTGCSRIPHVAFLFFCFFHFPLLVLRDKLGQEWRQRAIAILDISIGGRGNWQTPRLQELSKHLSGDKTINYSDELQYFWLLFPPNVLKCELNMTNIYIYLYLFTFIYIFYILYLFDIPKKQIYILLIIFSNSLVETLEKMPKRTGIFAIFDFSRVSILYSLFSRKNLLLVMNIKCKRLQLIIFTPKYLKVHLDFI